VQIASLSRFARALFVCSLLATGLLIVGCDSGGSNSSNSSNGIEIGEPPDKITDGRIAFTGRSDPSNSSQEIYTIGTSGELNRVTNNDISDTQPTWSPDGNRIAFIREGEIHTIKPDGSDLKQVTDDGAGAPAWSPDGSRIAFESFRDGEAEDDIYTIKPDGSDLKQVTDDLMGVMTIFQRGRRMAAALRLPVFARGTLLLRYTPSIQTDRI